MTAHSFLPPSGAAAWSKCAQWPHMNALFPQDDTPESVEGTAAHWVNTEMLAGRITKEGTLAPNGIMVTGEMLDGAELYCDTIGQRAPKARLQDLHIEERVTIHTIHPECFGTPDTWVYTVGNSHLEVFDYKYGHGFVDEFWNPQGLLYVLGIVEHLTHVTKQVIEPLTVTVSFTVVQPRCYYRGAPVRTHSYILKEAGEYVKQLAAAGKVAYAPNPKAVSEPEWCDNCPGRHACDALQLGAYRAAEVSSARQPHNLTPQAAALELRMLETALGRLEARVDGLRELTLANLRAGKRVPHYRVESGKGRRQWTGTPEQIITIGQLLGKDLSKPGLITPSQAEKLGVDASVISAYASIIPGAARLVAENNADARRVFGSGE